MQIAWLSNLSVEATTAAKIRSDALPVMSAQDTFADFKTESGIWFENERSGSSRERPSECLRIEHIATCLFLGVCVACFCTQKKALAYHVEQFCLESENYDLLSTSAANLLRMWAED